MDIKEKQEGALNIKEAKDTGTTEMPAMSATVLGLSIGDDRYLVHMKEISEVIQVPEIVSVPLTQSWFLGIINVHGNLYGITDLGVYLGAEPEPFGLKSRILLVSSNYKINSGFIVRNILGIRNLSEFALDQTADTKLPTGVSHVYNDKESRQWYELDLRIFIREKRFLEISR
ncbi:chemotaxis protein CheW [Nitrosomonas aestuarii]|uniref:chemotaxis protein CheW n=1 Tax=Nitrosomonas aestuarii TaxID=52441 RepID=UPI000D309981|nr:chemotaxis protein CheW [Nitrosomonas aestuarii]PTN12354.1 CheW protein [Nitrosomonas aestuarii]